MSGELVPSQFRYTTTNNRDFVIGDPTDSNLDQPKYLVFQMTNLPGYNNNPHIKAEKISGNWKLSLSENGSTTYNFAYLEKNNTFTGTNTFQNATVFSGAVNGPTATFTTLNTTNFNVESFNATGNVNILGDLTVTGTTTQLNVTNVAIADKNIVLNHGGSTAVASYSGISIEGDSGAIIAGVSLISSDWSFTVPGRTNAIKLRPPVSSDGQAVISADNLTSMQTHFLPQMQGTNHLFAMYTGKSQLSEVAANRVLITDNYRGLDISTVTSTELGYLSGVTSNVQTQLNSKADQSYVTSHILSYTVSNSPANGQVPSFNGTNLTWITPAAGGGSFDTALNYSTSGNWDNTGTWTFLPGSNKRLNIWSQNTGTTYTSWYGISRHQQALGGLNFNYQQAYLQIRGLDVAEDPSAGVLLEGCVQSGSNVGESFAISNSVRLCHKAIGGSTMSSLEVMQMYGINQGNVADTTTGSSIILTDKTNANKYALYFDNGILTIAQV